MVFLKFKNINDLAYFTGIEADHKNWLGLYNYKKISNDTIYLDNTFLSLIDPNKKFVGISNKQCIQNKNILFSRNCDFEGNGGISFYDNIEFI